MIPLFSWGKDLRIGLNIYEPDRIALENKLNNALKTISGNHNIQSIKVKNLSSYLERQTAFLNNEVDILETTYRIYYEANRETKRVNNYEMCVILHSCYASGNFSDQFYSHGLIVKNKADSDISLDNLDKVTKVYAVDRYSSTGYYLQKQYLENKNKTLSRDKISFLHTSRGILDKVKSTPGSIGMCGSFIHPDKDQFTILAETPNVPGQVVIAPENLDPNIIKMIQKTLIEFSIQRYRKIPKQRYFYVYPLKDDYKAYLDLYADPELNTQDLIKILYLILGIFLLIIIVVTIRFKRTKEKILRKTLSIEDRRKQLSNYKLDSEISSILNVKKIDHFVTYLSKEKNQEAIQELTSNLEQILPQLLRKIQENKGKLKHNQKENSNSDPSILYSIEKMPKLNKLSKQVAYFSKFCYELRAELTEHQQPNENGYDGPFKDPLANQLIPLASLDGSVTTLYSYRNFSIHKHLPFLTREDAETVLKNYLHFYQKICESRLFEKD